MKKTLSVIVSAAVGVSLLTAMPVTASETVPVESAVAIRTGAEAATSGKCGDNVNWELQGTKLVITGSGDMFEFETIAAAPWNAQRSVVSAVEIGEGVTSVAPCGFANMSKMTSVSIPSTATYIGRIAFSNCSSLTSVDIPAGVEFLGKGAFKNCSSLQSVTIRGKNTEIKGGVETISNTGTQYDKQYSYSGTIYGESGSKAESFASANGIKFSTIGSAQNTATTTTTTTTTTSTTTTTTVQPAKDYSLGDVNGDKLIDAVDASMVLSEYAKISSNVQGSFNDDQKKAADVDYNGLTDAVDASKILSYYAYASSGSGQKMTLQEFIKK